MFIVQRVNANGISLTIPNGFSSDRKLDVSIQMWGFCGIKSADFETWKCHDLIFAFESCYFIDWVAIKWWAVVRMGLVAWVVEARSMWVRTNSTVHLKMLMKLKKKLQVVALIQYNFFFSFRRKRKLFSNFKLVYHWVLITHANNKVFEKEFFFKFAWFESLDQHYRKYFQTIIK